MEKIASHFNGKLYDRDAVKKWDLPDGIEERLDLDSYDYYFLSTSVEKQQQHGEKHIHFSIYPTRFNTVYLLQVETPTILPELLHNTLEILKNNNFDIITSTGFCTRENICYFGIFYSVPEEIEPGNILSQVKNLDNVDEAIIFRYSCEGCFKE